MKKKEEELIFIPFNTPSLKNSKIKTSRGIFPSKTVKNYISNLGIQRYSASRKEVVGYKNRPNLIEELRDKFNNVLEGKEPPFEIGFHFVRKTKHKFDFNNANQIIADLLVAHGIIEEDNMDIFIPYAFKMNEQYYTVDKENPGVYIKI